MMGLYTWGTVYHTIARIQFALANVKYFASRPILQNIRIYRHRKQGTSIYVERIVAKWTILILDMSGLTPAGKTALAHSLSQVYSPQIFLLLHADDSREERVNLRRLSPA
jgi:hypothetical protein